MAEGYDARYKKRVTRRLSKTNTPIRQMLQRIDLVRLDPLELRFVAELCTDHNLGTVSSSLWPDGKSYSLPVKQSRNTSNFR